MKIFYCLVIFLFHCSQPSVYNLAGDIYKVHINNDMNRFVYFQDGVDPFDDFQKIVVADLGKNKELITYKEKRDNYEGKAFSNSGRYFAFFDSRGKGYLKDTIDNTKSYSFEVQKSKTEVESILTDCFFSPNEKYLFFFFRNFVGKKFSGFYILNIHSKTFKLISKIKRNIHPIENQVLLDKQVVIYDNLLLIYDLNRGKELLKQKLLFEIDYVGNSFGLLYDRNEIYYSAFHETFIHIYNYTTREERKLELNQKFSFVKRNPRYPDYFFIGMMPDNISVWSISKEKEITRVQLPFPIKGDLKFIKDGDYFYFETYLKDYHPPLAVKDIFPGI